ncbi:MAG: hypothetical protein OHK0029_20040 [Armatimonadaceae bacterium]
MSTPFRRQYQIFIDRSPQAVFDFLTDLKNVERLAAPDSPQEVVDGGDGELAAGSRFTLRIKQGALRQKMEMEIAQFEPPTLFVERQVRGPFASWQHRHRMEAFQKGTLLTEQIEYTLPAGPLGALTEKLWVGAQWEAYFAYRHQEAKRLLELVGRIKGRE